MAVDEQYAQVLRDLTTEAERVELWRKAALAFEQRAMRVEYVIRLLVAAGHVPQQKVDEAFNLAKNYAPRAGVTPTPAPTPLPYAASVAFPAREPAAGVAPCDGSQP
jgi:hypothetical protein